MTDEQIAKQLKMICDDYAGLYHPENENRQILKKSVLQLIVNGYEQGWDACAREYEKLNGDAVRLWNENEELKKKLNEATVALEYYTHEINNSYIAKDALKEIKR